MRAMLRIYMLWHYFLLAFIILPYFPLFSQTARTPAVSIGYKGEDRSHQSSHFHPSGSTTIVSRWEGKRSMDSLAYRSNLGAPPAHLELTTSIDCFVRKFSEALHQAWLRTRDGTMKSALAFD
ncbi:hypothetical protein BDR06DRAFT_948650 [Suillus hirtellus]|nr:hypothetical protein BDR06DRAFT_948650 [Suillus hirtellus]